MEQKENLSNDLMEGASVIAEFYGTKKRRVYYLLERGQIPAFKVGNRWCARKSTLLKYIAALESGE